MVRLKHRYLLTELIFEDGKALPGLKECVVLWARPVPPRPHHSQPLDTSAEIWSLSLSLILSGWGTAVTPIYRRDVARYIKDAVEV